jgi:hypothetical protein
MSENLVGHFMYLPKINPTKIDIIKQERERIERAKRLTVGIIGSLLVTMNAAKSPSQPVLKKEAVS